MRHEMADGLLQEQPSPFEMKGNPDKYIIVVFAVEAFVSWKDYLSGDNCVDSSPFGFLCVTLFTSPISIKG